MKIYIVTDGIYSNYHVVGVYSTQEAAERAKVLYASDNDIEEFELDAMPDTPNDRLYPYEVSIHKDGNVADVCRLSVVESWYPDRWFRSFSNAVVFIIRAQDEKHAVKIANEKRAHLIASGEWETAFAIKPVV